MRKIGDRVRCINNMNCGCFTIDKYYTIRDIDDRNKNNIRYLITTNNGEGYYTQHRFATIKQDRTEKLNKLKSMKKVLAIFVGLLMFININAQVNRENIFSKTPTDYVSDYEGILSLNEETVLNRMIHEYKTKTSIEFCVVTIDSEFSDESDIHNFGIDLFNKWGVGSSELDNGLLLVVSVSSRKFSVNPGYGLEPLYTDYDYKNLTNRYLKPNFKNEEYFLGIKEFLLESMNTIGDEGFEQLIQKREEQRAERIANTKKFFVNASIFIAVGLFIFLIVYLIRIAVRKYQAREKLSQDIDLVHDDIMRRKEELVRILGKVPPHIEQVYIDNVTNNSIKVDSDTLNRLLLTQSALIEHKRLINSTNKVITKISSEKQEIEKYLKDKYKYCEDFLKSDLDNIIPDTNTPLFTSTEFTSDRYHELTNLNNSLSWKINGFLKNTQKVNSIVSTYNGLVSEIGNYITSYKEYKENKKLLMTFTIGKRLESLSKIDINKYIDDIEKESTDSMTALTNNDFKTASEHFGIYLTLIAVLERTFDSVSNLVSQHNRSVKYVKNNSSKINIKITNINSKISKSGVSSSRSTTLSNIEARVVKFKNTIAFDIILAASLLKFILDDLDDLYSGIKSDIQRKIDSDARKVAAAAAAAAAARRRRNSSSGGGFGGFGGGSTGGGGGGGSF